MDRLFDRFSRFLVDRLPFPRAVRHSADIIAVWQISKQKADGEPAWDKFLCLLQGGGGGRVHAASEVGRRG